MSQSRPIVFLGLAIAIALVTSLLIYKKLQGAPVEPMEEGANVAVAARMAITRSSSLSRILLRQWTARV